MAEWVHTFKGAVLASEYDFASHMNSHMYVSRFDQATWFLLHAIGMTPASMKQKNLRVAIVRQNYQFLEELRGGELVEIKSGFLAIGAKYFRFRSDPGFDETEESAGGDRSPELSIPGRVARRGTGGNQERLPGHRRKVFSLHPSDVQRRDRQDGGDLRQRRRASQPGVWQIGR